MRVLMLCFLLSVVTCCAQGQVCVRHIVVPAYPVLARMARVEGTVTVEAKIGPDGRVISAESSGGQELLQRASEQNIRQWTFSPGAPGETGCSKVSFKYIYKLKGKEDYYDATSDVTIDLPDRVEITARPAKLESSISR